MHSPTIDHNAAQSGPGPAPIFVVGSMRSGSTMLRLILDSHPRIAVGAETGFMGALLANKQIPNWRHGGDWYRRLGWSEAELDVRLREFYEGMFVRYAAGQGKARWGEKTPFHTAHMAAMAQVFPTAVFVGIIRHPAAVATSLRDSFHYAFSEALSYWEATNLDMVRAAGDIGSRFVLCRYEDLVLDSEPVLRELMAWLGEPWSPSLLEHHRVQREQGAPRVVDGSTSSRDRIDTNRVAAWVDSISSAERTELDATTALADYFGYAATAPAVRGWEDLGGSRRWLPDGCDLNRCRSRWADRVDFERRPPTLSIDANAEELASRVSQLEQALHRTRSRRSVRAGEALRKVQRVRSMRDVRDAFTVLRGLRR